MLLIAIMFDFKDGRPVFAANSATSTSAAAGYGSVGRRVTSRSTHLRAGTDPHASVSSGLLPLFHSYNECIVLVLSSLLSTLFKWVFVTLSLLKLYLSIYFTWLITL